MANPPKYQYLTTELDPNLLSTNYRSKTNWHVITGAACTGKTTLINRLAEGGYRTVDEGARQYFEQGLAKGLTLDEIVASSEALQLGIFEMQICIESELRPDELIFLDRALPDSLTFHRVFGLNPDELLPDCLKYQYASVFILDRLPVLRSQTLGPEDEASSIFLDKWLERDYRSLGYDVFRVPAISIEARLAYILDNLTAQGFI
jgi:predicted ATPase